jgi:hypothetical protein
MLLAAHAYDARAGHAHEQHVHLLVNVLPDPASSVEAHQVGVKISAPFEGPDHPRVLAGGRGEFVQVHRASRLHTASFNRNRQARRAG